MIGAAPYRYDALGRLYGAGTPLAIAYEDEGDRQTAERNPSTGATLRRHVFGPGANEPLVWYEGSGTASRRFLHADERGSTVAATESSGALHTTIRYDEYGVPQWNTSAFLPRFLYTGQRYFGGVGLYYYKARFYDPKLGRFLQTDPIGYGDGMNMYGYVGGDPVNFADPTGLEVNDIYVNGNCNLLCRQGPVWEVEDRTRGADRGNVERPSGGGDGSSNAADDIIVNGTRPKDVVHQDIVVTGTIPRVQYAARPTKAPCFTLSQRREHHDRWVAREAARLRAAGYQVATEVSMRVWTPKGDVMARADIVARLPGARYYLINEIKTGDARFSANQSVVYNANIAVIAGARGLPIGLKPGDSLPLNNFSSTRCQGLG